MIQARNVVDGSIGSDKIDFSSIGDMTQFLSNNTSIDNYSYAVPNDYKLAYAVVYIDSGTNQSHKVGINSAGNVGYKLSSTRSTFALIVKGGDKITVTKESGSGSVPWHVGYIRKLF